MSRFTRGHEGNLKSARSELPIQQAMAALRSDRTSLVSDGPPG